MTPLEAMENIKNKTEEFYITVEEAAPIIGSSPNSIRLTGKTHPEWLGFEICRVGEHLKIPREPFIQFWTGRYSDVR